MDLSTRHLRAFVALAELRSFTRAAQRCHLSQSAFSTLIRSVENALGARLFDRDTRHVELTAEGELFRESAQRLLGDFEGVVADFKDHAARRKGRVAVAALPSLAAGWLPAVFAEFRQRHPAIDIALFDTLSDNCIALLRAGKVDFALASSDGRAADLASEALCTDDFHLVCPRGHPLARKARLQPADLLPYPFVHLARTSSVRQHLDAALHPLQMRTVLEVEHLATVTGMVTAGVGITVVPALTLFHFRRPGLALRRLALPQLRRRIYLVRRAGRSLSVAAQALYDLMRVRRPRLDTGTATRLRSAR
jgi:DNA-binding transcriptional LysR family regulator